MEFTTLGRTRLEVSRLCLGTMNFGWDTAGTTEADAFAIMDRALEHGINFFDTANVYGSGPKGAGTTEQIIGRWFAGRGRRDKVVLATKVYGDMGEWPNESRLSALHIRRACDESLRRLQTDYIDLYQMHHVDRAAPWEEVWQAMEQLVTAGKVIYVGSSNFGGWHIARAQAAARERNFLGLVSEQTFYNLLGRTVELEVLPACREFGLGVIPWSPLARGALAGALDGPTVGRRATSTVRRVVEEHRDQLEAFEKLCTDIGEHPADVALAWLLAQDGVTAPIIGPRNVEQLDASLRALEVHLDSGVHKKLDAIFPGPGGAAPEAYAW
jgi:aryl-alcohol dehydrogenase-like predicted oxidoreductase